MPAVKLWVAAGIATPSTTLLFCASLPECYVLPHLSEVLHVAGQLEEHTEYRIRQTAAMVFPVMMKGGLTTAGGGGVAQVLKVRLIHATIRHLILHGAPQEARGRIEPQPVAGGPANLQQALLTKRLGTIASGEAHRGSGTGGPGIRGGRRKDRAKIDCPRVAGTQ